MNTYTFYRLDDKRDVLSGINSIDALRARHSYEERHALDFLTPGEWVRVEVVA